MGTSVGSLVRSCVCRCPETASGGEERMVFLVGRRVARLTAPRETLEWGWRPHVDFPVDVLAWRSVCDRRWGRSCVSGSLMGWRWRRMGRNARCSVLACWSHGPQLPTSTQPRFLNATPTRGKDRYFPCALYLVLQLLPVSCVRLRRASISLTYKRYKLDGATSVNEAFVFVVCTVVIGGGARALPGAARGAVRRGARGARGAPPRHGAGRARRGGGGVSDGEA